MQWPESLWCVGGIVRIVLWIDVVTLASRSPAGAADGLDVLFSSRGDPPRKQGHQSVFQDLPLDSWMNHLKNYSQSTPQSKETETLKFACGPLSFERVEDSRRLDGHDPSFGRLSDKWESLKGIAKENDCLFILKLVLNLGSNFEAGKGMCYFETESQLMA